MLREHSSIVVILTMAKFTFAVLAGLLASASGFVSVKAPGAQTALQAKEGGWIF